MSTATAEKPNKQEELPNMPKPKGAALKALEYLAYKEDLDSKYAALEKRKNEVLLAMKKNKQETFVVQSPETQKRYRFTVKLDEKLSVRSEPIGKVEEVTE
jgi:hypothetical protein